MTIMSTAFDLISISAIFERFLGTRRLADEQTFEIDADALGPAGVKCVFCVDESRHAALLLSAGHCVQGHGSLAARFRAEDFNDSAARQPPPAQGNVEAQRPGRDALHVGGRILPELHDRALAELLLDLRQGILQFPILRLVSHDDSLLG